MMEAQSITEASQGAYRSTIVTSTKAHKYEREEPSTYELNQTKLTTFLMRLYFQEPPSQIREVQQDRPHL